MAISGAQVEELVGRELAEWGKVLWREKRVRLAWQAEVEGHLAGKVRSRPWGAAARPARGRPPQAAKQPGARGGAGGGTALPTAKQHGRAGVRVRVRVRVSLGLAIVCWLLIGTGYCPLAIDVQIDVLCY